MSPKVFFTATTGRTGTTTLVDAFSRNLNDCVAEHEPVSKPTGPLERAVCRWRLGKTGSIEKRGFGQAIQWYDRNDVRLKYLVRMRARRIRRFGCQVYLESSHAFLSSQCDEMVTAFPDMGLIHLLRDPLEVAVSFRNRSVIRVLNDDFLSPVGKWHPLPDQSRNCLPLPKTATTTLQYYLWIWIDAELRCLRFLERNPQVRCFHLDTYELNSPQKLAELFDNFGLEPVNKTIQTAGVQNRNSEKTSISDQDIIEVKTLLQAIDPQIIQKLPYPYKLGELAA